MATVKERKLIMEITDLALDIGAGDYNVSVEYHGHIHAVDVRVALRGSSDWEYYADTCYLSGRRDVFTEDQSIRALKAMLAKVKKYHKVRKESA